MRNATRCIAFTTLLILGALVSVTALTTLAQQPGTPAAATPEASIAVVRDVLGSDDPDSAPGELFELARYTIPAHAVLPVHTHPGVQMAIVESGALTYHVIDNGSVHVTRADGAEEVFGPGETATFETGDAWIEPEGMVHYAENLTGEPVVLIATSLLEAGEPTAILVEVTTPAD